MNVKCPHCHAVHFKCEKLEKSSNASPRFRVCCLLGQINLPALSDPPHVLHCLFTSSIPHAQKFKDGIHQYNMAFAFTSVIVKVNDSILEGHGPYSFRMHGVLYHKMGALHPHCPNFDYVLMGKLQDMLNTNNPFFPLYKQAYQIMHDSPPELQQNLQMEIVLQQDEDHHRYNLSTVDEVTAIISGIGEEDVNCNGDTVLHYKHGGLCNITHLHPLYTPLHYGLLFPNGDQG